jgi:hypothetical protein
MSAPSTALPGYPIQTTDPTPEAIPAEHGVLVGSGLFETFTGNAAHLSVHCCVLIAACMKSAHGQE